MTDRIALTEDEVSRLARAMDGSFSAGFDGPDLVCGQVVKKAIVRAVVKAINAAVVPADDPIGTVRRPAGVCAGVGVRVGAAGDNCWQVVHLNGETRLVHTDYVADWPVIYRPDGAA